MTTKIIAKMIGECKDHTEIAAASDDENRRHHPQGGCNGLGRTCSLWKTPLRFYDSILQ